MKRRNLRYVIVKRSQLDPACWLPARYMRLCHTCEKYRKCKVKVVNRRFEMLEACKRLLRSTIRRVDSLIESL